MQPISVAAKMLPRVSLFSIRVWCAIQAFYVMYVLKNILSLDHEHRSQISLTIFNEIHFWSVSVELQWCKGMDQCKRMGILLAGTKIHDATDIWTWSKTLTLPIPSCNLQQSMANKISLIFTSGIN